MRTLNAEFAEIEPYIDWTVASKSRKILIRAYFYNRLDPLRAGERVAGWRSFIGNICNYDDLHRPAGRQQIRLYCAEHFGLEIVDDKATAELLDKNEIENLTAQLLEIKAYKVIAENDAKHILMVYATRDKLTEYNVANPLGFRTWWLTQETRILTETAELIREKGPYIMRAEFLLNFIMFSPSAKSVAEKFADIIPSLLGIRLTNRMRPEIFRDALQRAREYLGKDEARVRVELSRLATQVKQQRVHPSDRRLASPFDEITV